MDFGAALDKECKDWDGGKIPDSLIQQTTPVYSLEAVKPDFQKYIAKIEEMTSDAATIEITDQEKLQFAVALGGEAKKIAKAIEAKKKEVTAEASDFVKSVNGFCKLFTDKLEQAERTVKQKISQYQTRVELERREAEKKAQEATKKLQAKIDQEAKEKGVEAPKVLTPVIQKQEKVTRSETGTSAYQVTVWKAEITEAADVPHEYCSPDLKKINEAVKMGVREIRGVRIYEETSTRFRT